MIATKLKALKDRAGLTVPEWSKRSNIPEDTINKILQGSTKDPRFQTIVDLVVAAKGSMDELVELRQIAEEQGAVVPPQVPISMATSSQAHIDDKVMKLYEDRIEHLTAVISDLRGEREKTATSHRESLQEQAKNYDRYLEHYREACDKQVAAKDSQITALHKALLMLGIVLGIALVLLGGYIVYDALNGSIGAIRY